MYLPDVARFLISCVLQHYAPVVGWGGVDQVHNVDYLPVKLTLSPPPREGPRLSLLSDKLLSKNSIFRSGSSKCVTVRIRISNIRYINRNPPRECVPWFNTEYTVLGSVYKRKGERRGIAQSHPDIQCTGVRFFFHASRSPKPLKVTKGSFRIFSENSRRYSQVKVHHRCQRHQWQICHRYKKHQRQI
jgi:hypothetical protein